MKIPFMKIEPPNLESFIKLFQQSIDVNQYSNFGPNEKQLTKLLELKIGYPVVCAANATLILDGLHHILSRVCNLAYLPGFTFPATNLGCRVPYIFGETQIKGDMIGFSKFNIKGGNTKYSITTVPFGTQKPKEYVRPNTTFWIVDNAAGASPDMEKIKEWLDVGADAVVVSLHATKILNGCEGGFVAFNNKFLQDVYRKYVVFGFYADKNNVKQSESIGSNHKLAELSAAYTIAYYNEIFSEEYTKRIFLADAYKNFCISHQIEHIYSPQAFWIKCDANEVEKKLLKQEVETKPYYRPLFDEKNVDAGSQILEKSGLCLPTWGMNSEQMEYVIYCLESV